MISTPTKLKKRAVIYCRVSTKEQVEEGNSLFSQEKLCREYALKHGYEIVKVFIEQGESAKTTNRTQLQLLLAFCTARSNQVTTLIAYKLDRIARNSYDYSSIRILLGKYGVDIKSTTEQFENDTPAGRFMENIIANVAQFDNDVRAERCVGGMREAMRQGRYVWSAPVGYSNVKVMGRSTIVPNAMAPLLLKAFVLIARNTMPIEQVRKKVSKEGLATKVGKPISKSQFYRLLQNELYCGWIIKFGERHKGIFASIVPDDIFYQVQRVLKGRSRKNFNYRKERPDFPLRRFIYHPQGGKLTGSFSKGRTKRYPYYRFHTPTDCSFKKEAMENAFCEFLDHVAIKPALYNFYIKHIKKALTSSLANQNIHRENLKNDIKMLNEKQDILLQKNLNGIISDRILKEHLELIEESVMKKNESLLRLPESKVDMDQLLYFANMLLKKPSKIWLKGEMKDKIALQWFHFPQGITFDGEELRTTEMSLFFKVKSGFLPNLSHRVDSSSKRTNPLIKNKELITRICYEILECFELLNETSTTTPSYNGKEEYG